jgi:hypothetical protein
MRAIPSTTSRAMLETKYGKIIRVRPQTTGTTLFCLLPNTKKPSPIEPNSNPQRRDDVSKAPNGEGGGPAAQASCALCAHLVPRAHSALPSQASRPPSNDC